MNHPAREEWMSYLYDECTDEQAANLAAHLAVCADCKTRVADWRGIRRELDSWKLERVAGRPPVRQPWLRWAAAAAILIGVGLVLGRSSSSPVDLEQMRVALTPALRQELRAEFVQLLRDELAKSADATLAASGAQTKELLGQFARAYEENRSTDNRAIYAALDKLESQRVDDYAALKRDLDTVAVFTDTGYRQTQRQLYQLANYTQPASGRGE